MQKRIALSTAEAEYCETTYVYVTKDIVWLRSLLKEATGPQAAHSHSPKGRQFSVQEEDDRESSCDGVKQTH